MIETGRQARTLKNIRRGEMNLRVMAFSSGKGGVGKTNLATNLSYLLCRKGKRVLIFDADVGLANIHILLGLSPKLNLQHVLSGEKSIDEIIVEGPGGIHILPAGEGVEELTHLGHEARLILLEEFERLSESYDYLIFDTAAGISSNVTFFCTAAQEAFLVATPEPTSLTDVYALMKVLCQNHNKKSFRLLVNSVKSENEAKQVYRNLSAVADKFLPEASIEYAGYVVADPCVSKSVRRQRPFVDAYPYAKASRCVRDLSEKILDESAARVHSDARRPFLWKDVLQVQ